MADLKHTHGEDLQLSPTGGLALSSGVDETIERIYRRIMTNPGDDIWNVEYGAGIPATIGSPTPEDRIKSQIFNQLRLEAGVDQTTIPTVEVTKNSLGLITANIKCVAATTGEPITINQINVR